jgi:hypothetical protein
MFRALKGLGFSICAASSLLLMSSFAGREKRSSSEKEKTTEREDGINQVDFQTRVTVMTFSL